MQAAGVVQDTFAGEAGESEAREAKRRRLEASSTATSTAQARMSSVSFLLNFYHKTLTHACVIESDVCIHIYIYRASVDMTK